MAGRWEGSYRPRPQEGMTYQEIAAEMGVTHQAVMHTEKRALRKLAVALKHLKAEVLDEPIADRPDYTIYF